MRSSSDRNKYLIIEKILLGSLITFAVLGTAGPIVLKQFNLALLGTYLAAPMLSAAVTWLVIRKKETKPIREHTDRNNLLLGIYLVFTLLSILILHLFPIRTVVYYLLIAGMGTVILIEILYTSEFTKKQVRRILLQIILLLLNIVWGVTLKYYFFIGRTDTLFHAWAVENLAEGGAISQTLDIYQAFPLWHILCAFLSQTLGDSIAPAKVMFIANGLVYACLVLVIYLVASRLFNPKTALLSSLFLCFNTDAIFYGMYSIPRSVIFFLEGLLLVFMFRQKTVTNLAICSLVISGLIVYHTASMPFILVILALFYLLQLLFRVPQTERYININFLLLISVSAATYLMYAGVEVFRAIGGNLMSAAPTGVLTKSIVVTPLEELFNYLQYSPLLFFVILGVLWGIQNLKLRGSAKILLVVSLILVPVTFPGPALLLNKLAGNFNLSRFGEYSYLFMCIAGAAGLSAVFCKLQAKGRPVIIALFTIMAFLSISNDFTASDNPLVKRLFYTFYLTEAESISLERAASLAEGYVMPDYIAVRYLENSEYANKTHVLEADPQKQIFLRRSISDLLLIRSGELSKRPLRLFTSSDGTFQFDPSVGDKIDYYDKGLALWDTLKQYNTVYDSGAVKEYQ